IRLAASRSGAARETRRGAEEGRAISNGSSGGAVQFRPMFGRVLHNARRLASKYRHAFLPAEDVQLAVGDHPGLRIRLIFLAARDSDRAKSAELRCIAVGIASETVAVLGRGKPVGRPVKGRRKVGRSLLGPPLREI